MNTDRGNGYLDNNEILAFLRGTNEAIKQERATLRKFEI